MNREQLSQHLAKGIQALNEAHPRWQFDVPYQLYYVGLIQVVVTPKPIAVQKAIWEKQRSEEVARREKDLQEASENEGYVHINKNYQGGEWIPVYSMGYDIEDEFTPVEKVTCDLEKLGNDWVYSDLHVDDELEGADWTVVNFTTMNDTAAIFPMYVGKESIERGRKYEEGRLRSGFSFWHMMAHRGDQEFIQQRDAGTYDITKDKKVQYFNEIVLPSPIPTE